MIIRGSRRNDRLVGGSNNDTLSGLGGDDTLTGAAGDDILDGGTGADSMSGGSGNDLYYVDNVRDAVLEQSSGGNDHVIATITSTLGADFERLTLAGSAAINGTGNALTNTITGNGGANLLDGGDGNDTLDGGAGNDTLKGGSGNDTLIGGAGNDILDGGTGADSMSGGSGDDTYYVDSAGDTVFEQPGGGNDHVIASIGWTLGADFERLTLAGSAAISGTGNALANTITGNGGANVLDGKAGNDTLDGGADNDTLDGGSGDDTLLGGAGNDVLMGGSGKDLLTGGSGADVFVFRPSADGIAESAVGAGRDRITSFTQGEDRIDVAAFQGAQNFTFIGTAAFTAGTGAQLRYDIINGNTVVQLDVMMPNGAHDGMADAEIEVSGSIALSLADFIGVQAPPPPDVTAPIKPPVSPSGIPVGAIRIAVGADAQSLVNAAPEGATFWFDAGVHRLVSLSPKNGQTFLGDEAAVISGARQLSAFVKDGDAWVIGGQTQQGERRALGETISGFDHAGYPNVVFMDNKPMVAVDTRAELGAGKFYFDYATDKIYLGQDPAGHLVEAAVSPFAFAGAATDVTIRGLTIEKYASPIQYGAIGYKTPVVDWTIEQNEVRLNFGVGIIAGTGSEITGNLVHNNGQMGIGGNGDNILVQDNEIAANGFWSGIDILWEGGGSKFAETDSLIVRGNFSHDNNGYGLWTDINNTDTLYEDNRLERNSHGGINHEISYDAVIRNNDFVGNGASFPQWLWGAAIQIQNSRNVEIYGNTIEATGGGNGISLIQQDRGGGVYGEYLTVGNYAHDNVVITGDVDQGSSGAIADAFEDAMLNGGNRFDRNEYYVVDPTNDLFAWGEFYDWDTYRAVSGQDLNSQIFVL